MFISCGKFDRKKYSNKDLKNLDFSKNYDFKHKEAVTGNSDYFEWNLECEKLNCNISYLHGVKKYSKKIVLKDYKQKNNIIKKIINGMKNPNENVVIDIIIQKARLQFMTKINIILLIQMLKITSFIKY